MKKFKLAALMANIAAFSLSNAYATDVTAQMEFEDVTTFKMTGLAANVCINTSDDAQKVTFSFVDDAQLADRLKLFSVTNQEGVVTLTDSAVTEATKMWTKVSLNQTDEGLFVKTLKKVSDNEYRMSTELESLGGTVAPDGNGLTNFRFCSSKSRSTLTKKGFDAGYFNSRDKRYKISKTQEDHVITSAYDGFLPTLTITAPSSMTLDLEAWAGAWKVNTVKSDFSATLKGSSFLEINSLEADATIKPCDLSTLTVKSITPGVTLDTVMEPYSRATVADTPIEPELDPVFAARIRTYRSEIRNNHSLISIEGEFDLASMSAAFDRVLLGN